jgi:transcriptional regulator with XRE-family HTH domain
MMQNKTFPPEIETAVIRLGDHIRIDRKRRAISMAEMASRMFVTWKTLARLENGEPGVSLGVFAMAFWVLGLDRELLDVALPEKDRGGIFLERQRLPKRIRENPVRMIWKWEDGLWIAKFPAKGDRLNIPRIEHATMTLAGRCGIRIPEVRRISIKERTSS